MARPYDDEDELNRPVSDLVDVDFDAPPSVSDEALLGSAGGPETTSPELPGAEPASSAPPADPLDALIAEEAATMDAETATQAQKAHVREVLRQKYAERAKAPASTEPGNYERIFRSTHSRPEGWKRILGALGGAAAGRGDGGHMVGRNQDSYDSGLAAAMSADLDQSKKSGYVDQATAEMLVKHYGMDPEDAANVRRDSDALSMMNNLGSLQLRERELEERGKDRDAMRDFNKDKWHEELDWRNHALGIKDSTQRYGIDNRKKKGGSGGGGGAGLGDAADLLSGGIDSYVVKNASAFGGKGLTLDQAKALREGNLDALKDVPPETLETAKSALVDAKLLAQRDPKKFASANVAASGREATNTDASGKKAAVDRNDPEKKQAARRWVNQNGTAISLALKLWNGMSTEGRNLLARFPGNAEGFDYDGLVRNGLASPEDQDAARAISALQNVITKERSGASVSLNEMARLRAEFGQGKLTSPRQLSNWLRSLKKNFEDEQTNLEKSYDNLWDD